MSSCSGAVRIRKKKMKSDFDNFIKKLIIKKQKTFGQYTHTLKALPNAFFFQDIYIYICIM